MELIEGRTLEDVLRDEKPEEFRIMGYILDLLGILVNMHSIRPVPMIHGDIKPSNIMIRENRAILIDFGSTSGENGSSGFCAPEKLAGFEATEQSDIYSVGQLMHYCLTGRTRKLFDRSMKGIDKGMWPLMDRALMKLPKDRYSSASEMANELQRFLRKKTGGEDSESYPYLICIPGNPFLACEIASVISLNVKTLLADLDLLGPGIDMLMGIKKMSGSSHEYGFEGGIEDGFGIIAGSKPGKPDILPCLNSFDAYEGCSDGLIRKISGRLKNSYDAIVLCCNPFPYDSIFIESLFVCDQIIFTVEKGPFDIRKINALTLHFVRRQGVNTKRLNIMGYGLSDKAADSSMARLSSEIRWLGNMPFESGRAAAVRNGNAYIPSDKSRSGKYMTRTLKKLEVF